MYEAYPYSKDTKVLNMYNIFMYNTSMVSFDGGSASKVDDVTA